MPGTIGNTNRATQYRIKRTLERLLEEASSKHEGMTKLEAACLAQVEKAEAGELASFKEVADRIDGKPAQTLDVGNKEGETFNLGVDVAFIGSTPRGV